MCPIAVLLLATPAMTARGNPLPEYQAKANILALLLSYIHWPPEANGEGGDAPFLIGVLGISPFGSHLEETLQGSTAQGRPVQIRYRRNVRELLNCQVVFICNAYPNEISDVLRQLREHPILTVGDVEECAQAGVMVNLRVVQNRIQLEVNLRSLRASRLEASSQVLKMARIVEK